MTPPARPCGSWPSPITSELIVAGTIRLGQPALDGDDLYWIEGRPTEAGRQVLVRRDAAGRVADAVGAPFNVRTRVHEYGGTGYAVDAGTVWFSDFSSGRLHRLDPGSEAHPITPEAPLRYADLTVDRRHRRLLCVLEDHRGGGEPVNTIAAVALDGGEPDVLCAGHDFAAAPRQSPDGRHLAWMTWDHPNMPWDESDLWVADLDTQGRPGEPVHVAGGRGVSVQQPLWAPDGTLLFIDDSGGGWWNLRRWSGATGVAPVTQEAMEFGVPMWLLGYRGYDLLDDGTIVATPRSSGRTRLVLVDGSGRIREVPVPFTEWAPSLRVRGRRVVGVAGAVDRPTALVEVDVDTGEVDEVRPSSSIEVDPASISTPRPITFPTEGGLTAHALYYPPFNPQASLPDGELPPLRVHTHGGPTANVGTGLDLEIQYFTSRGFAVVDVDYGGSTGYGREYRERLRGQWGVVDVADCVNAARHLVAEGLADERRLVITGGSAGGYTTLRALTATDVFAAGCSLFGIGDLAAMARDTHKFESRYLDGLVAPYPERADVYEERSPLAHADRLSCPIILFQGLEDAVVPPNQAETFFEAALRKGIPCAYIAFEGEQHGFRIAANIRRCLDGELAFYARVFGFTPAEALEPVPIRNLEGG